LGMNKVTEPNNLATSGVDTRVDKLWS